MTRKFEKVWVLFEEINEMLAKIGEIERFGLLPEMELPSSF